MTSGSSSSEYRSSVRIQASDSVIEIVRSHALPHFFFWNAFIKLKKMAGTMGRVDDTYSQFVTSCIEECVLIRCHRCQRVILFVINGMIGEMCSYERVGRYTCVVCKHQ